jgi:hypothetical protein
MKMMSAHNFILITTFVVSFLNKKQRKIWLEESKMFADVTVDDIQNTAQEIAV